MPFVLKKTKEKVKAGYRTIYLRQTLINALEQVARDNSTSFNNVVVSMLDHVNEAKNMLDEEETTSIQKAAMFDLIQIIKKQPDKAYTVAELEAPIVAYVSSTEQ